MKVYDLMMQLAKYSPYAEVGCVWDDAAADIESVTQEAAGEVLLWTGMHASMDIRLARGEQK
jgi:hypothetical protein